MGKPSIFSKDYERRMKKRRRRIIILVVVIVAVCLGAWLFGKGIIKSWVSNIKKNSSSKKQSQDIKNNSDKKPIVADNKQEKEKKNKIEGYEVKLSNGETIKIMYEDKNGSKKFKYIAPKESKINYDISPTGNGAIVYDEKMQKIIYVNIDGKISDVGNTKYISTDGSVVITREEQVKTKPDYVWCTMPKFIDDNNVAYITQLPWFERSTKYVWVVNVQNNNHINIQNISGEEIKIDKLVDKGLTIIADGKTCYLKANGEVAE
ncbi:hypothetical protein [Clostridium rectalis]|uniref:hypothetical protein n=1 Tax=Clostridium rectalis TaxID=2040295 RepID=UPI000F63F185|nr:hypothetical protein [Clostridium rectalis]